MRSTHPWRPEIIAHRGACADAPENTIQAFDLALAQGADALELDLRATRDGEVVVLHDPTLARTHGVPDAISAVRLQELCPEHRPLTLAEVLDRYAGTTELLLELKGPGAPADAVVAQVIAARAARCVTVQSFVPAALRRVRQLVPALPVAPLCAARPTRRALDRAQGRAEGVGVPHGVVDAALVHEVHARGLRLRAYTPIVAAEHRRLAGLGVDGLITDVPAVAVRAVALRAGALRAA